MRPVWVVLALGYGCQPVGDGAGLVGEIAYRKPQIVSVDVGCKASRDAWWLDVQTNAWSAGGGLVWTLDGRYVERHEGLRSVQAAADGSSDLLRLEIPIAIDFRATGDGRTAFVCGDTPEIAVMIDDIRGEYADCVRVGDHPDRLEGVREAASCETLATPSVNTDELSGKTSR